MPRLRDIADRKLGSIAAPSTYKGIESLMGRTIKTTAIEADWDDIVRIVASIKEGTVAPSAILRKLAAYKRQNRLDFTTVIFPTNQKENLKYICAVLNARLLNFRFKGIGKLKSNGIREYFDNAVSQLPIRRINWNEPRDVEIHNRLVVLYDMLGDAHHKLTQEPAAIVARSLREQISSGETELDSLVCELYGLSLKELTDAESVFT